MGLRTVLRSLVGRQAPASAPPDDHQDQIESKPLRRERRDRLPPTVSEWMRAGADPSCRRLAVETWRRRAADMDDEQLARRVSDIRKTMAEFRGQRSQPLAGHLRAELDILEFESAERKAPLISSRRSIPGGLAR